MNLKTELIKGDIEDYKRRIDYCDKIINKTIKNKHRLEERLKEKEKAIQRK